MEGEEEAEGACPQRATAGKQRRLPDHVKMCNMTWTSRCQILSNPIKMVLAGKLKVESVVHRCLKVFCHECDETDFFKQVHCLTLSKITENTDFN